MIVAEECVDYEDPGRSKENLHTFSKLWTDRVVCNGADIVDGNDVDIYIMMHVCLSVCHEK